MNAEEFERIKTWNQDHPERHYGTLAPRHKRNVERGWNRPPALEFLYWLLRGIARTIWFLIGVVFVFFVIYVLYKLGVFNHPGPACPSNDGDCIY